MPDSQWWDQQDQKRAQLAAPARLADDELEERLAAHRLTQRAWLGVVSHPTVVCHSSFFEGGDVGGILRIGNGASQHGTTCTMTAPLWQAQSQSFAFFGDWLALSVMASVVARGRDRRGHSVLSWRDGSRKSKGLGE